MIYPALDLAKPDDNLGDLIAPGATEGSWNCAMMGGWSGWIPSDRLTAVPATPAITTQQWLGTWIKTHVGMTRDRLILTRSAASQGKIHVEGRAYYTYAARNMHLGGVSGESLAMGPFLHILDQGENDGCVLDLKYNLSSDTFRAVDNHRCGGGRLAPGVASKPLKRTPASFRSPELSSMMVPSLPERAIKSLFEYRRCSVSSPCHSKPSSR